MDFEAGHRRVRMKEINNRTGSHAKGLNTRTPRKAGAKSGFASNGRPPGGGRGKSRMR